MIRLAAAAAKRDRKLGVVDPKVNKLARYRSSKSGKAGKNAARDFHRLLHRDGKLFPVTISTPMIPIRRKVRGKHGKRRSREKLEKFPCLVLSSWMEEILRVCPKFMCGGHDPCTQEGLQQVQHMFKQFWDDFKSVQPGLPIYQRTADEQMRTVPIAIHGDEGRGLGKTPILVLSYQLIIPHTGPDCLNMSQHSFTTRLLFTLVPSTWYCKDDATIDGLHQCLADDLCSLFHEGLPVKVGEDKAEMNFYVAAIGCKGDWPWVRKAFHLASGYRSTCVCHLCPSEDWWDVSSTGQLRTWQGRIPTPFKQNKVSPLRSVPGFETPDCIRPDLMHCFNIGIGGDLAASGLMASCRMSIFGEGSLDKRLDEAHDRFDTWCSQNKKTASIKSFEKKNQSDNELRLSARNWQSTRHGLGLQMAGIRA